MLSKEKVFDGHVHCLMRIPVRESYDIYKAEFKDLQVKKAIFASCASHHDAFCDPLQNLKCLYYKARFSPNAYAYASFEINTNLSKEEMKDDLTRQVKEYLTNGYDGMKTLLSMPKYTKYFGFNIDDERLDGVYEYLEQNGKPFLMHLAHPKYFWDLENLTEYRKQRGWFYDNTYPHFNDYFKAVFKVLDKYPNLHLFLAHWGFMGQDIELAEKYMSYKNTKLDITPGGEQYIYMLDNKDAWIEFIKKYSDRITYGTDQYNFDKNVEIDWKTSYHRRPDFVKQFLCTKTTHQYGSDTFTGINLPRKYRKKIFTKNLEQELGTPQPINFDYALAKIEERFAGFTPDTLDYYDALSMKFDFNALKNGKKL